MTTTTLTSANDAVYLYEGYYGTIGSGGSVQVMNGAVLDGAGGTDTIYVNWVSSLFTETTDASGVTTLSSASGKSLQLIGFEKISYANGVTHTITATAAASTTVGTSGNDTLTGTTGADAMAGGMGDDTYSVDNAGDTVTENADAGTDSVQASVTCILAANVENLTLIGSGAIDGTGNDAANALTGNDAANTLTGLAGNDTLSGGLGNDSLDGGDGSDSLAGGDGADTLLGGKGADSLSGGKGADSLAGGNGADVLTGGNGADTLTGGGGNDALSGGAGADVLTGGAGNDTLTGGAGTDTLTGGADNDTFAFAAYADLGLGASADVIADFTAGADLIDLAALDADANAAGRQAFVYVASFSGTDATGEVSFADGYISISTNADSAPEYQIRVDTVGLTLDATNFLL
jgi:Ca2+-binding RTX toxin-like protein